MTFGSSDEAEPHRPAAPAQRGVPSGLHGHPHRRPGAGRPTCARRALPRVSLRSSVRIAYDVTPLSHPRTGVGNYILGALKGMVEAADGSHELVAFGPVSIRGRRLLDATLADLPVERRIATVPFGHAVRTAWSRLGRPPAERFVGNVDVLHFTRLDGPTGTAACSRHDDSRPRPVAISRATTSPDGAHAFRNCSCGDRL